MTERARPERHLSPKDALIARGLRPKKSFGQNFLVDETHVRGIAALITAGLEGVTVVELGAGTGALTRALVEDDAVRAVHAVERDRDLAPVLRASFPAAASHGRFFVHEGDAATVNVDEIFASAPPPRVLCGNLPYHLTSTLILRAIDESHHLARAVFLIQKEVALRVAARPGDHDYSVLSVLTAARFDVELARVVPKGAFWPAPEVDGGVLVLATKSAPVVDDAGFPGFKAVVKQAFNQRRKTLRNTLKKLDPSGAVMTSVGIDPGARAETLDVTDFARLAQKLDAEGARA